MVTLLAACGGGDNSQSSAPVVKPTLSVSATQVDCAYQADDFVVGEVARPVFCLFVQSGDDATITEVPVTMSSSGAGLATGLGDGVITRVQLTTMTDKGVQQLTEATGFTAGKLTLRANIALKANQPVVMALRINVEMPAKLVYLPADVKVNLQVGSFTVKYDEAKYVSADKIVPMTIDKRAVRYVEPLTIVGSFGGIDYMSGTGTWLGNFTLVNPAKADRLISTSYISLNGSFQEADIFVANCFSNLRVVYQDQGEVLVQNVSTGNYAGKMVRVPAGKSVIVSVYADTGNCVAPQVGAQLNIVLQVYGSYEGMALREEWQGYGEVIVRVPWGGKG